MREAISFWVRMGSVGVVSVTVKGSGHPIEPATSAVLAQVILRFDQCLALVTAVRVGQVPLAGSATHCRPGTCRTTRQRCAGVRRSTTLRSVDARVCSLARHAGHVR